MSMNARCPRCGSERVVLTNEKSSHGCLWTFLFGIYYILWRCFKAIIGLFVFLLYDWWVAIIQGLCGKPHVWVSRKLFSGRRRYYYCQDCGNNFKL